MDKTKITEFHVWAGNTVKVVPCKEIAIFPWIKTVLHGVPGDWAIAEYTTGLFVTGDRTRKLAIEAATEVLKNVGEKTTLKIIASKPKLN